MEIVIVPNGILAGEGCTHWGSVSNDAMVNGFALHAHGVWLYIFTLPFKITRNIVPAI